MGSIQPESIQRIALIMLGGIGDVILYSPVIRAYRQYFPHADITLLMEERSKAVSELLPDIDRFDYVSIQGLSRQKVFLQLFDRLRHHAYDLVVSHGSSPFISVMLLLTGIRYRVGYHTHPLMSGLLTHQAPLITKNYAADMYYALADTFLASVFGTQYCAPAWIQPALTVASNDDRQWAAEMLSATPPGMPRILVHPGVSRVSVQKKIFKGWPAPAWAQFIQQACATGRVFLVGGPDDDAVIQEILAHLPPSLENFTNLYGMTRSLPQLAALIQQADVFVSVDSGPMHVAVGLDKPVVAMFGPTDPKKLLPDRPRFQAIARRELPCRPCLWDIRTQSCHTPVCLDVPVDAMIGAVLHVLETQVSQAV